jgi:deoxyribodipyrimidine photo-lyase
VSATVVWFRQDLRLRDNPALSAAVRRGGGVLPVFIIDPEAEAEWGWGAAARWWLHHSLAALDATLRTRDSRLVVLRGRTREALRKAARAGGADAIHWNRRYEPHAVGRDAALAIALRGDGFAVSHFNAALLHEPAAILNRQGRPFQVFGPYWRECVAAKVDPPVRLAAGPLPAPSRWPASAGPGDAGLLRRVRPEGYAGEWRPGEAGARERLRRFLARRIDEYDTKRDLPAAAGTSGLSPHLHFGEIGPRQIWAAVRTRARGSGVFPPGRGAAAFLRELGWREFAHQLLFHFPHTPAYPLRRDFAHFPWADDPGGDRLRAWQHGATGYPLVDAGMRELRHTGWMHNRVRMIAASFLVKHLRLPWTAGAAWFWETLVDADLANNTLGWQWSAGCGADAAPYFRIFAPVLQGRKFDRAGDYVRRWVPVLAKMPAEHIHAPWQAPAHVRQAAGVRLGDNYPGPIVDHAAARAAALAALREMRVRARTLAES